MAQDSDMTPTYTDSEKATSQSAFEAWLAAHPYGDQDENGIDLSSLRHNLRLTPTERLARLQSGVDSLRELTNARTTN